MRHLEYRRRRSGETLVGLSAWHFEAPTEVLAMSAAVAQRDGITIDEALAIAAACCHG